MHPQGSRRRTIDTGRAIGVRGIVVGCVIYWQQHANAQDGHRHKSHAPKPQHALRHLQRRPGMVQEGDEEGARAGLGQRLATALGSRTDRRATRPWLRQERSTHQRVKACGLQQRAVRHCEYRDQPAPEAAVARHVQRRWALRVGHLRQVQSVEVDTEAAGVAGGWSRRRGRERFDGPAGGQPRQAAASSAAVLNGGAKRGGPPRPHLPRHTMNPSMHSRPMIRFTTIPDRICVAAGHEGGHREGSSCGCWHSRRRPRTQAQSQAAPYTPPPTIDLGVVARGGDFLGALHHHRRAA